MARQTDLLQELNQKYVIDACSLLDFWGSIKDYRRVYDVEVDSFRKIWDYIAQQIADGTIILPTVIHGEVDKTTVKEFHEWLLKHKKLCMDHDEVTAELAQIVNKIPIYTTSKASLPDAILVAIAKNRGLTVITSEHKDAVLNINKPMVPNVCEELGVKWVSLPEYFVKENL